MEKYANLVSLARHIYAAAFRPYLFRVPFNLHSLTQSILDLRMQCEMAGSNGFFLNVIVYVSEAKIRD
jgi:hypothetical protein